MEIYKTKRSILGDRVLFDYFVEKSFYSKVFEENKLIDYNKSKAWLALCGNVVFICINGIKLWKT